MGRQLVGRGVGGEGQPRFARLDGRAAHPVLSAALHPKAAVRVGDQPPARHRAQERAGLSRLHAQERQRLRVAIRGFGGDRAGHPAAAARGLALHDRQGGALVTDSGQSVQRRVQADARHWRRRPHRARAQPHPQRHRKPRLRPGGGGSGGGEPERRGDVFPREAAVLHRGRVDLQLRAGRGAQLLGFQLGRAPVLLQSPHRPRSSRNRAERRLQRHAGRGAHPRCAEADRESGGELERRRALGGDGPGDGPVRYLRDAVQEGSRAAYVLRSVPGAEGIPRRPPGAGRHEHRGRAWVPGPRAARRRQLAFVGLGRRRMDVPRPRQALGSHRVGRRVPHRRERRPHHRRAGEPPALFPAAGRRSRARGLERHVADGLGGPVLPEQAEGELVFEFGDRGHRSRVRRARPRVPLAHRGGQYARRRRYDWTKPGKVFRYAEVGGALFRNYDWDGDINWSGVYQFGSLQLLNYHQFNWDLAYNPWTVNNRRTRGGPLTLNPPGYQLDLGWQSDTRKAWVINFQSGTYQAESDRNWYLSPSVDFRPASNVLLSVGPNLFRELTPVQYVGTFADPAATTTFGNRYVFGTLHQTELSAGIRLNWTYSPALSLQVYAQPLISAGRYGDFKEVARPRTFDFSVYGRDGGTIARASDGTYVVHPITGNGADSLTFSDPNFNFVSLRGNAVLRWEYLPGSTIFFVWTQSRSDDENIGDFRFRQSMDRLLHAKADNIFLVKVSYWWNP